MNSPLVSVVMPTYNAERYVDSSIKSVLNQSFSDWELLVVDDCSADGTSSVVEWLAEQDSRVKLIKLSGNTGGPATPRNIGVKNANGKYVAFLDSDDIWHPEKLQYQLDILRKGDDYFCSTRMLTFNDESKIAFAKPDSIRVEKITFLQNRIKCRIPTSSVLVKRDVKLRYPFNEEPRYKAVEDYDCWLRIHQNLGPSLKLDFPLLYYRHVEGQISGSKLVMMRRVFMVHRQYEGSNLVFALFFTISHVFGGIFHRYIKKGL